ncbi:Acg family FMN-binding oxidoreductase [Rhodococcus sp. NPDC058505]|uniref:Acg family FMN-binding oxidoreductase n=1 Tax=unclassified Rhodococcus (in: high G+C Gram-positive bacteria) TaxID=192944 RepID=UPI003652D496
MDALIPDTEVVRTAVDLACRAPSVHNSQPWRWRYDAGRLELSADPARLLVAADPRGRQLMISCGAALQHLTVALTALRWQTHIDLFPDPARPQLVAAMRFANNARPQSHDFDLLAAIRRRRTDRTAFAPLPDTPLLRNLLGAAGAEVTVTFLGADARPVLAEATASSLAARRYDASYQAELRWWAGHIRDGDGIPEAALATRTERQRVPVGRRFPDPHGATRTDDGPDDESTVLVLSTTADDAAAWLRCGRALSAIALEATVQRLATCPLTHLTDIDRSRDIVRTLIPGAEVPQLLLRVGIPTRPTPLNDTPRRPIVEVLTFG